MSSDLRALLAAIVADPGDDTARLAYADCLQEHGNDARASFIRLQIDAERLHPHSNARVALEEQALALFQQHWIEWWDEVCAAVGAPELAHGRYERAMSGTELVAAVGIGGPQSAFDRLAAILRLQPRDGIDVGRQAVAFRRGFPEAVCVSAYSAADRSLCAELPRWAAASPLTELTARGFNHASTGDWPEGPHLARVRRLRCHSDLLTLPPGFQSPHLTALEDLTVRPNSWVDDVRYANVPARILSAPWCAQLRSLDLQLRSEEEGADLLSAPLLAQLRELRAELPWLDEEDDDFDQARWLTRLARSESVRALRRLKVEAKIGADAAVPLVANAVWTDLRYLALDLLPGSPWTDFFGAADLPVLEEMRLAGVRLTSETVRDLVAAPLLKRLKHVALFGGYENGRALIPLVDAVDPERIETFAIGVPHFPERAAHALRAKFGDRVRFLTG